MVAHTEKHSHGSALSDVILGGQDGIVNTLGAILGLAAASSDIRIIIAGGLAAAAAQSISMAAVAYTSTLADAEYYESELARENYEIDHFPDVERQEIYDIYHAKGFRGELLDQVTNHIISDRKVWLDTMMLEELSLTPVHRTGALRSAFVVGASSFVGCLMPLIPFFLPFDLDGKRIASAIFSSLVLFLFGAYKTRLTVGVWWKSGLQLMIIGMVAAFVGFFIGKIASL